MNGKITFRRVTLYLAGLLIIATGINISKMTGLGISPVSATPRALEVVWGFTLGKMVILIYCLLVLAQFFALGRKFRLINLLGVPVGILFGSFVDFMGIDPKAFGHLLYRFPRPESYPMRLVYLLCSIVIIGFGVYVYLKPRLVPMPAEGLAQAISEKSGKTFGDCKTLVDTSLILLAVLIQLLFGGGFKAFAGDTVVVREGTVLAALSVGQVVKFFRKQLGN